MRKSILNQTELAFQAYIVGGVQSSSALFQPVNVYAAHQLVVIAPAQQGLPAVFGNITLPSLIFQASQPEQIGYDSGIYELKLRATLETQDDDEMDVAFQDVHHARVEALRDALESFEALYNFVNKPAGTDTRTVQNFTFSAIAYENEEQQEIEDGRRLTTVIDYYIAAAPQDDSTPVGTTITVVTGDDETIVGA